TFLAPRLLEPDDARVALERELRHTIAQREMLEGIKQAITEGGGSPFEPAVDLGLRIAPVIAEWLRDQLAALPDPSEAKS
ncbi:MAG: PadR family transcriptional regulator, partial [Conexibacter sp.]|nr:PadR family transcriptional regulator [Conexibacter sp.]